MSKIKLDKSSLLVESDSTKILTNINDFEKVLSQRYTISDEPSSRSYVFPSGKILALGHNSHASVLHWLIKNEYVEHESDTYTGGCPPIEDLGCIRVNLDTEGFIMLSKVEPTSRQYKALLNLLDKFWGRHVMWRWSSDLMILEPHQKSQYKYFSLTNKTSDDIIYIIKNYYQTGRLVESSMMQKMKLSNIEAMHNLNRLDEDASSENVDSQGNKLTNEQIEFFKNSQVRDDENRLLVVYHGTHKKFDKEEFTSQINWFSVSKDYAKEYGNWTNKDRNGGHQYQCYLGCSRVLDCGSTDENIFTLRPIMPYDFSPVFKDILKSLNADEKEMRAMIEEVAEEYDEPRNGYKMKIHVLTRSNQFKNLVVKKGYDGLKCIELGHITFGVFNANDIKSIDNKKPTNSKNINEKSLSTNNIFYRFTTKDAFGDDLGGLFSPVWKYIYDNEDDEDNDDELENIIDDLMQQHVVPEKWLGDDVKFAFSNEFVKRNFDKFNRISKLLNEGDWSLVKTEINRNNVNIVFEDENQIGYIDYINESEDKNYKYLYHATYKPFLKSIKEKGLGNTKRKMWTDSVRGVVYLADDKDVAYSYAETAEWLDDVADYDKYAENIIVLKIDVSKLEPNKLKIDSNVVLDDDNIPHTYEYHGIIPFSSVVDILEERYINESEQADQVLTRDEIEKRVMKDLGTSSEPVDGPSYIMRDGSFLKIWEANVDINGMSGGESFSGKAQHLDVDGYIGKHVQQFRGSYYLNHNCIRVNTGFEEYMVMPEVRPNSKQFDSLLRWLEYYFINHSKIYVLDWRGSQANRKVYYSEENFPEDIIKKIKRYYATGRLEESNINKDFLKMSIPVDSGMNIDNLEVCSKKYSSWYYFGNCINTVDTDNLWDATDMSQVIFDSCLYLDEKNLYSGDRKLPKQALEKEVITAVNEKQKIGIIYNTNNDIHYFFDVK